MNAAAQIRVRAERRMGEELNKAELKAGKPKANSSLKEPLSKPRLSDIGVTRKQSSVYQQLAAIPEETFEAVIEAHSLAAAKVAGLSAVPAWVRDIPDDEAFMALVLCNTHGELTPLERGMHALKSNMDVKAYAELVGRARTTVVDEVKAARVSNSVTDIRHDMNHHTLSAIHAAPSWLWPALVSAAHKHGWTVEAVRSQVAREGSGHAAGVVGCTCDCRSAQRELSGTPE